MREIKFRAWWKVEEHMLYQRNQGSEQYEAVARWLAHPVDYDIMQFTGLKSKSGVDIYEGDIVKYDWEPCGEQTGVFIFDEGTYFLKGTGRWRPLSCEVIGNIYENGDLLSDKPKENK